MTSEQTLLYGLDDIRAIRFTCKKCGATKSFQPLKWKKVPTACDNCEGGKWVALMGKDEETIQRFSVALEEMTKLLEKATFDLRLEFERPSQ